VPARSGRARGRGRPLTPHRRFRRTSRGQRVSPSMALVDSPLADGIRWALRQMRGDRPIVQRRLNRRGAT
jgi:hypothetical protein